jgi:hypothetical protein
MVGIGDFEAFFIAGMDGVHLGISGRLRLFDGDSGSGRGEVDLPSKLPRENGALRASEGILCGELDEAPTLRISGRASGLDIGLE